MKVIKQLIPRNKFILSLSGGVDSLSVAIYLKKKRIDFVAYHYNGNFIKQDSKAEIRVRDFCNWNMIDLVVVSEPNKFKKGSAEDYCRKSRYNALGKVCDELGIHEVICCHNLDDCVTSYMFDILRGHTGRNPIPFETHFEAFKLTRPFLLAYKAELSEYARKIYPILDNYVTSDELNNDQSLTRNFLRDQVIPLIHTKKHFNLNTVVKKIVENKLKAHYELVK